MNLYWIGARQWDVKKNAMFTGSITRYGEDIHNNYSFCNNTYTSDYDEFVKNNIDNVLEKDDDAYFLFADEMNAYKYGSHVYEKSICTNKLSILEALNDKIFARNFFSECIKTPNSIVINASSCLDYNFIHSVFNNKYSSYVLQESRGAGGHETYFLTENNAPHISQKASHVLVTPYYNKSISVNIHIIVGEKTFRIMPPSLQITIEKFKYSGSDYIAYQNLNTDIKAEIIDGAKKIAQKVQTIGGKGIFGVDLLVTDNKVLFLECNYRYQGSSFLLDMGLQDNGFPSLFNFRYDAFYSSLDTIPDNIYDIPITYSSFRRTANNIHVTLPNPFMIIAPNNTSYASKDKYMQYEIFNTSIIQNIAKQEAQNLC